MPQLLSVSRAARLVGITRAALQSKIRGGELETFEGKVKISDLLRVYPRTHMDHDTMLAKVEKIKAEAMYHSTPEHRQLPAPEVLAKRLTALGEELAKAHHALRHYLDCANQLSAHLEHLRQNAPAEMQAALHELSHWVQRELHQQPRESRAKLRLLAQDTFLRVLAAHVKVLPSGHEFFVEGSDSVLQASLRAGLNLNYGCTDGRCGACKVRLVAGEVRKLREHDYPLSDSEYNLGYFLMCSSTAVSDIVIEAEEAASPADLPQQELSASLQKLEAINEHLLALHLRTPKTQSLRFMAGQYVNLRLEPEGPAHPYYLASCPCDGHNLVFHLHRHHDRDFVGALANCLPGQRQIQIDGPHGDFVLRDDPVSPVLLLAYGTGFAPIKSLVEHAVAMDKLSGLHLYWFSPPDCGHYLDNLCRSWEDALDHFSYTPLSLERGDAASPQLRHGLAELVADFAHLRQYQVYLAGPEFFLEAAHLLLAARGLAESRIHRCRVD